MFQILYQLFKLQITCNSSLYSKNETLLGGGNSNIVYFQPDPWGNDPIWLAHIFRMGWLKPPTRCPTLIVRLLWDLQGWDIHFYQPCRTWPSPWSTMCLPWWPLPSLPMSWAQIGEGLGGGSGDGNAKLITGPFWEVMFGKCNTHHPRDLFSREGWNKHCEGFPLESKNNNFAEGRSLA